ncbi:DUF1854 domain-containing protein [Paenibacillus sp. 1001270B_150601_E10]|uniref:DUF1854 domain-containing protein n=1 Tax=Paenibacillus sp. 1001270B_150601_E10 TaxID=2787079 RepID=UPI00189D5BD2|nr:DUF1854 domain-containing protein [Paenibacillus sp. 1001270B_150601_E10]
MAFEDIGHDEGAVKGGVTLAEAAKIKYLTPHNAQFVLTKGRMLSVTVEEKHYPSVYLHCSFPHSNRLLYISVRTLENEEVGMIESLDDFPEELAQLLKEQIAIRYFAPIITKVIAIKEEFGYAYWEAETQAGRCRFTVRNGGGNAKLVSEQKLLIQDVDGNRFLIERLDQLSEKEYRMVEMCL